MSAYPTSPEKPALRLVSDFDEPPRERRFGEEDILNEDELINRCLQQFIVDGLLGDGELSVAWGAPKDGAKSLFWLRMARRLSQGQPAFGRAPLLIPAGPPTTLFIALEGQNGIGDRVEALRLVDGPAPNFRLIIRPLDFLNRDDVARLGECVDENIRLVVIDTLGRALGSSGADENGPDMARLIGNLDVLRRHTGSHFTLIHHGAKSGGGGPRGHSSLIGSVDTAIEHRLNADRSRTATVTYARNHEAGLALRYGLRQIELPADGAFRPARTSVIAEELGEAEPASVASVAPKSRTASKSARGPSPGRRGTTPHPPSPL